MPKLIRITTVPSSMRSLLKGQLRFMTNYFEVVAISSDSEDFDEIMHLQGDIRGYRVEMTRKITIVKDLKALFGIIKILRRERPDIVHTHTPKAGLLGMLAAWICRVPHRLHTIAGMPLLEAHGLKRVVLNFVERLTNACATNVYPNSFVMMDIMRQNRLASPRKMKVLGNGSSNGIDVEYFSPEAVGRTKEEIRRDLGIYDNMFTFVFVGRIVRDKGMNELVEAIKLLDKEGKKFKVIIVGRFESELDPLREGNEEFIRTHSSVCYVGLQSDVRPYLLAADALVFPSYREGFPNVVMQAGAMGLPCIVTDINGCNEIVEDGVNGVIIPPKDVQALHNAMTAMCDDADFRARMALVAREKITSRYKQQDMWDALLTEYNEKLGIRNWERCD